MTMVINSSWHEVISKCTCEKSWPVYAVKLRDVLANKMNEVFDVGTVELGIVSILHHSEIVRKCIEPYIDCLIGVVGNFDAPIDSGLWSAYRQIITL